MMKTVAIKPPANSLNVIAVGGIDDDNSLDQPVNKLYHSSFGKTIDDLMKPELVAHAIWIAAPILPGTKEQEESAILHQWLQLPDTELLTAVEKINGSIQIEDSILRSADAGVIKENIRQTDTNLQIYFSALYACRRNIFCRTHCQFRHCTTTGDQSRPYASHDPYDTIQHREAIKELARRATGIRNGSSKKSHS